MGMIETLENFFWQLLDNLIKGIINLTITLLIYFPLYKKFHFSVAIGIAVIVLISLIVGTITVKVIKIEIANYIRMKYYLWLDRRNANGK
jgi:mannose/fructose/N-acetylgalactosamine-specific phosphotransferase system component IID